MNIALVTGIAETADVVRRVLGLRADYRITWSATTGGEAAARCSSHPPDLVLLDLATPGIDGVATTRGIMTTAPSAILLFAPSILARAGTICEAISHGALDAVKTPVVTADLQPAAAPLLDEDRGAVAADGADVTATRDPHRARVAAAGEACLIAIGASTGGPAVLASLLRHLPKHLPAAVVIVQHVDRQFAAGMAEWLNQVSGIPVRVAKEGDHPSPGDALRASTCDHLAIKSADRLGYVVEPADYAYRPSVDVFSRASAGCGRGMSSASC